MNRLVANRMFAWLALAALWQTGAALAADDSPTELAAARRFLLTGKYAEAVEAYQTLSDDEPVEAALGIARCHASQGQLDEAAATLQAALKDQPRPAALHAELAGLLFGRGEHVAADEQVTAALAADEGALAARWWRAELLRTRGELEQADRAYKWFVDYYNDNDVERAEDLHWVGQAAAQYARWHRLSGQFSFLVNELYPDALKADADYWPAHYESGLLFSEKYNQPEALRELTAALAINPNAAEVYAALASLELQEYKLDEARRHVERALEINPRLVAGHQLRADLHLANFQAHEAIEVLEAARRLNPLDEQTLGRLAAAYAVVDGVPDDAAGTRLGGVLIEVTGRNAHAGEFFYTLAAGLDLSRRFPAAARYYRESLEKMPRLTAPRGALAMMQLRLGDEADAKRLLDESFEIDPFNVRVSNSLKVLEVLDGYAVLETEHFVLKFDRGHDDVLARYASRYLEEEVYPALVKRFGYAPSQKSLFEIFSRARNTDAHGWFSARMVGLPYVSTVGACAGKMVAMTSPNELRKKFNWARVLKHEFVHVLNLQQTAFNVPHWFTEALAVETEGYPRPQVWDELLRTRVPKGELFNIDTINLGFVRPASSLDWQMAYCQAQLYAQYMLKTYGDDALAKMLAAYADNLETKAALRRAFAVEQEPFEQGYRQYVEQVAGELAPHGEAGELGRQAEAKLQAEQYGEAAELYEQAARQEPQNLQWSKRLAKLYLTTGDDVKLAEVLQRLAHADPDDFVVRKKLAQLALAGGRFAEAARWCGAANQIDVLDADVHRMWGDALVGDEKFSQANEEYEVAVRLDADDAASRLGLAKAYLAEGKSGKASAALKELLKRSPDHAEARQLLEKLDE